MRASRGTYGRPRLVRALRACAHAVGPKRVARLMREAGLRGKVKGRFTPRTTVTLPRFNVQQNVDNFLVNGERDGQHSVGTKQAVHG